MKNIFECYFIKFTFSESSPKGMSSNSANQPPTQANMYLAFVQVHSSLQLTPTPVVTFFATVSFKTRPWNLTYTSRNYNLQELSFTRGSFAILWEYQMAVLLALRWGGFSPHPLADSQDKASASGQCSWCQNDGARRQKIPSAKDVCHLLSSSPHITQAPKDTLHTLMPGGAGYATQQQHIRTLADCGIKEKVVLPTTPKKFFLNTFLHC